ncbi:PoNe immunity protein domain-containing protein [Cupriavidus alkaliphilus]
MQQRPDPARDVALYGYWAWRAGAATMVLDIDDSRYRNHSLPSQRLG